jgi:hypothetical protein
MAPISTRVLLFESGLRWCAVCQQPAKGEKHAPSLPHPVLMMRKKENESEHSRFQYARAQLAEEKEKEVWNIMARLEDEAD